MANGRARPHYLVQTRPPFVEAWAVDRLGSEPSGWQAEMRAQLRSGIASLPGSDESYFVAAYVSEVQSLADAENVLFYALGLPAFSVVRARGILFERAMLTPLPSPVPLSGPAAHYQIYEVTPQTGPRFWSVGPPVASFEASQVEFPLDTAGIWAAVRQGDVRIFNERTPAWVCVRIRLGLPVASRTSALSLLGPLLDGALSVLDGHDGSADVASVDVRVSVEPEGSIAGELYEATPVAPDPAV